MGRVFMNTIKKAYIVSFTPISCFSYEHRKVLMINLLLLLKICP